MPVLVFRRREFAFSTSCNGAYPQYVYARAAHSSPTHRTVHSTRPFSRRRERLQRGRSHAHCAGQCNCRPSAFIPLGASGAAGAFLGFYDERGVPIDLEKKELPSASRPEGRDLPVICPAVYSMPVWFSCYLRFFPCMAVVPSDFTHSVKEPSYIATSYPRYFSTK
jgi:hypothetical protein